MSTYFHSLLIAVLSLFIFGLMLSSPSIVSANEENMAVEVEVILAKEDHSGIPSDLSSLRVRLTQQFSQFTGFILESRQELILEIGQVRTIPIPDGMLVSIEYLGENNGQFLLRIQLPGGSTDVSAPSGGLFFVGGPELSVGTLILAIHPG